ncbi:major egg antigen-like [Haliotis rubra]|uniref:major egg antigen-like n=1 Tax=Haliotis rubra TaxID=36100 RepID=UPI001EE56D3C|nr:major egg antigen-like [Haliotis rubra]XP_046580702.1 major egg antigen-like [Haliotis rubra]XP_046580703.1 major egg antigen-like [Haliotis rubra]
MARFRSELHIPIKKDDLNFQDRQISLWTDMESRMEQRRKEWENEFEKMRHDFFTLKPSEKRASIIQMDNNKTLFETDSEGRQKFKVRFDVSEFKAEEIQVKVQQSKIIVNARHEEKTSNSTVSREYSRQVDIPSQVDPDKLQCLLSKDGILSIEGPVQNLLQREVMLPIQSDTTSKPLGVATPVKNPIITEADGSRRLRLQVDVGEFNPEDIVVKTMDKKLIVHAERQEKMTNRTLHKEFNKEYDLPDSVDPTTITAYIAEDKQLTIEAPLKPLQTQRKSYAVTQSSNVRKVSVTKDSAVTITDSQDRPMVTISVHRR